MKFNCSIIINKPKDIVAKYFAHPTYLNRYQDNFIRKEFITGEVGQQDSIAKMYYKQGKGEMELVETITLNRLPDEFIGQYTHKNMDNTMRCVFTALSENQTQYDSEIEYTEFRGFVIKTIAFLFPWMFKKQVQKWLNNFKEFVEKIDPV